MVDGQSQHQQTGWCADGRHPILALVANSVGVRSTFPDSFYVRQDHRGDNRLARRREKTQLRLNQDQEPGKASISLVKGVQQQSSPGTLTVPQHGASHFSPGGRAGATGRPPLQTGQQRNPTHPNHHQPHPMEAGDADGPTGRRIAQSRA